MLLTALLAGMLAQTPEETEGPERDLSFTVELSGGRQLGASGFIDFEAVPARLYLNGGYTLLKAPPLPATDTSPAVPTAATHVFSGGVDWTQGRHFSLSFLVSGSPKATDQVVINPNAPPLLQLTLLTWRSSLGATLMAGWASGGLSDFEWVIDGGFSVTANKLGRGVKASGAASRMTLDEDALIAYRGSAGLTLTFFDRADVALRAGLNGYSTNPLTAGRFSSADFGQIARTLSADAARFTTDLEALSRAAQTAATRIGQADSLAGYASAPLYVEARLLVRYRFGRRVSADLGWTYNRYVPTAGYSNILSSRVTVKLGTRWRVWVGGALQHDQPLDQPARRTPDDPQGSFSGLVTVGAELTL